MVLYNVIFRDESETLLIPKVPYSAGDGEDKVTERICLSSSVRGCIQAIGPSNRFIAKGAHFIVREAIITDLENILNPVQLFLNNKVPDALENMEYWYTKPLSVTLHHYELIEYAQEYEIAWSCVNVQDLLGTLSKYTDAEFTQPTSKQIYLAALKVLNNSAIDALWEDIAELPWSQRILIRKLKVLDMDSGAVLDL